MSEKICAECGHRVCGCGVCKADQLSGGCGRCGACFAYAMQALDAEKVRADAAEQMVVAGRWVSRAKYDEVLAIAAENCIDISNERDAAIAARDEAVARLTRCEMDHVTEIGKVAAAERARDEAIAEAAQWREALTEIVREIDDEDGCMGIDCEPLDPKETSAQRLVTAVVRRVADLQSWTRRYVMGDRMMGDATSEEEAARNRVATLVADRDTALMARDEVGIQLAAAQAEIARMRPVVALLKAEIRKDDRLRFIFWDVLRALDAVPGDALAREDERTTRFEVNVLNTDIAKVIADALVEAYGQLVEVDLVEGGCSLSGSEVAHVEAATRVLGDAVERVRAAGHIEDDKAPTELFPEGGRR